jgi:hypothetical protein
MGIRGGVATGEQSWFGAKAIGVLVVHAALVLTSIGCGSRERTVPPPTDSSLLRGVVRCYAIAARDLGRPPQKMEELEAVLAPATDDPSKYLRSLRDGEEFVVVWGLSLEGASPETVLAYEHTGVDGKRMVVNLQGDVTEVTEEELKQMEFPKDYKPLTD